MRRSIAILAVMCSISLFVVAGAVAVGPEAASSRARAGVVMKTQRQQPQWGETSRPKPDFRVPEFEDGPLFAPADADVFVRYGKRSTRYRYDYDWRRDADIFLYWPDCRTPLWDWRSDSEWEFDLGVSREEWGTQHYAIPRRVRCAERTSSRHETPAHQRWLPGHWEHDIKTIREYGEHERVKVKPKIRSVKNGTEEKELTVTAGYVKYIPRERTVTIRRWQAGFWE